MPYCKAYTETIVAVAVTIVSVEIEHSCIRSIVIVTTTFEERVVRIDKVGIIVLQVYPCPFRSIFAQTQSTYFLFSLFLPSVIFTILYWSDNRYHITVLQGIYGNYCGCGCCRNHCPR